MQTRNAQQARRLARERRAKLDADRADRDQRVEQATTDTILALQDRDQAVQAQHDAEVTAGTAMRRLVDENLRTEDVATLCDVPEALVKRLTVLAGRAAESPKDDGAAVPAEPAETAVVGGDDAQGAERADGATPAAAPRKP